MQLIIINITLCLFITVSSLRVHGQALHPKLEISFNANVELLGLCYFLGYEGIGIDQDTIEVDGEEMLRSEFHAYGFKVYQQYESFQNSDNMLSAMMVADHLWLDYIISILLRVESFPNASIPADMRPTTYLSFSKSKDPDEAKKNLKTFLESLNAFYTEVDFDQYLEESRIFYETAMNEITSNLPDAAFIDHMEVYFQREYDVYHLIPSLTLPKTMGFGPRFDNQAYNVFGAVGAQMVDDPTTLQMGFSDADDIRELSVHEFGHSFVNPVLDSLPNHLIDSSKALFPPVKEAMYWQGYNNWNGCVYEHFVRATELIIAEKTRPTSEFLALIDAYLVNRRFVYIPTIKSILEGYTEQDITFREAVEESLAALIQLAHE